MNKTTETIWQLRRQLSDGLSKSQGFPKLVEYGHQYSIALAGPTQSVADTFRFNPTTYAFTGDSNVLKTLFQKFVPNVVSVELVRGTLTSLLEEGDRDRWEGITRTNGHYTILGSAVRYTLPLPPGQKKSNWGATWYTFTDEYILTINPIREWRDEAVDAENLKRITSWLDGEEAIHRSALTFLDGIRKAITPE